MKEPKLSSFMNAIKNQEMKMHKISLDCEAKK